MRPSSPMFAPVSLLAAALWGCTGTSPGEATPSATPASSATTPSATPTPSAPAPTLAGDEVALSGAVWTLAFEGAEAQASGGPWTTDQGYEVDVEAGWIVSATIGLVDCATASLAPSRAAPDSHNELPEPSLVPTGIIEAWETAPAVEVAALSFPENDYCLIHYALGPALATDPGLPEDVDLVGLSLYVRGTWTGPDGAAGAFEVNSSLSHGIYMEVADAYQGGEGAQASVEVRRDLAAAFDGVDFAQMSEVEIEVQLLLNLVDGAQVGMVLGG